MNKARKISPMVAPMVAKMTKVGPLCPPSGSVGEKKGGVSWGDVSPMDGAEVGRWREDRVGDRVCEGVWR